MSNRQRLSVQDFHIGRRQNAIMPHHFRFILMILFLTVTGCNRAPTLISVHGIVQFQGQPLTYGSVMFQPTGGGKIARSAIGSDGSFQLSTQTPGDGVAPGTYRVRVTAFETQKRKAAGQLTNEPTLGKSVIPKQYQRLGTSPLSFEIQPDIKLPLVIDLE